VGVVGDRCRCLLDGRALRGGPVGDGPPAARELRADACPAAGDGHRVRTGDPRAGAAAGRARRRRARLRGGGSASSGPGGCA
jgi:hypothetical protein